MFTAIVTEQVVTIISPTGQTTPAGNEKQALLGKAFADRETAIQACEKHFTTLKSVLQQKIPNNPLISQSILSWQGNCGTPQIPLGIRGYDTPPAQIYEVSYTVFQTV